MPVRYHTGMWIHEGMWGLADRRVMREVLSRNVYRLDQFSVPSTVLDVGAHIGSFTLLCKKRWPECRVTCIEPMDHNIECLRLNVTSNVKIMKAAVCESDVAKIHWSRKSKWPWEASVHDKAFDWDEIVEVPGISSLDQFGRIDLLKFDCEGGESAIICSSRLCNVRNIVGEWHRNIGGNLDEAIVDLTENGWQMDVVKYTDNLFIVSGHNTSWD